MESSRRQRAEEEMSHRSSAKPTRAPKEPPANVQVVLSIGTALIFEYSRAECVILEMLSSPFAKRIPQRFQEVQQAFKIEERVRPCSFPEA